MSYNMEITLLKLVNNERVMGIMAHNGQGMVLMLAPIRIEKNGTDGYMYMPYDSLSCSSLAVFSTNHILNMTLPKEDVLELYVEAAESNYQTFDKYYSSYLNSIEGLQESSEDDEEDEFDLGKLNDMFSEFMNKPDRKKFH